MDSCHDGSIFVKQKQNTMYPSKTLHRHLFMSMIITIGNSSNMNRFALNNFNRKTTNERVQMLIKNKILFITK